MRCSFKRLALSAAALLLACGTASADAVFTQSNTNLIPCSISNPCGTVSASQGTGVFAGDLIITVQLSGPAGDFQLDRFGFDSDLPLTLECFAFTSYCTMGQFNGASLGDGKQFDGFGWFDYDLETGLHGGSDCCKTLFTFAIGETGGGTLTLADLGDDFAGHAANPSASGFIATEGGQQAPEPSSLLMLGSGLIAASGFARRRVPQ